MSDGTTPPRSMPTPLPDMSVSDYRLMMVESECRHTVRELKKLNDTISNWRSTDRTEMALAVERCSSHSVMIRELDEKIRACASDESTAVIRVVNHEIDKREFAAAKDHTARWGSLIALIIAAIGAVAQALGLGPK